MTSGIMLTMAVGNVWFVFTKQCGHETSTLQPHCLAMKISDTVALVTRGLSVKLQVTLIILIVAISLNH